MPLQRHETIRALIKLLISGKHASYKEIALQCDLNPETLKSFALGKSRTPRGNFFEKLENNIRKLALFDFKDDKISRLISELLDANQETKYVDTESLPYLFFSTNFGISKTECVRLSEKLNSSYVGYRIRGRGFDVLKFHVDVNRYSEKTGLQTFRIRYSSVTDEVIIIDGYVYPIGERILFSGRYRDKAGFVTIVIDQLSQKYLKGIALISRFEEPTVGTKLILVNDKKLRGGASHGLISREVAMQELGILYKLLSNKTEKDGVLEYLDY